nr:hypothetical protein [uncultured Actinoplanes sp.]
MSVVITARDPSALPHILRAIPRSVAEVVVVTSAPFVCTARPDLLLIRPTGSRDPLATGIAATTGHFVVTFPGDGSADPAEIPRYISALLAGADIAVGSASRRRRLLNRLRRTDPDPGCVAFRRAALPHVARCAGDLRRVAATSGLTVTEIPRGTRSTVDPTRPDWAAADRRAAGDPIWSPGRHRPSLAARPAAAPDAGVAPVVHLPPPLPPGPVPAPAPRREVGTPPPPAPAPAPRREVGTSRRRLELYAQPRPDLRVINGEGRPDRPRGR